MDCYENKVRLHCVVIIIHYICSYVNTFTPIFFFLSFPLLWSASVAFFFGGAQSKWLVTVQHHVFSFMMTSLSSAISPRCPRTCLTLTRLILPASFDSNNFTTISLVFHSISLHKGRRFVSFAHSKVVILALRQVLTFYVYILTYIHTYICTFLFFWESSSAFFDVRVFNSHAPSNCKTSNSACYWRHELQKRRAYERRIIEVEHGSFTPIVLSTSDGWGPLATVAFRRLAGLLSIKHSQPYSTTLGFIWSKIAFSLVESKIMCLQGARSSFHNPTHNTIGGRTVLWTSSQTRPGCSIGLA